MTRKDAIAGGYFLVARGRRPPTRSSGKGYLPEWLWTQTSCICDLYPEEWAFSWAKYDEAAAGAAGESRRVHDARRASPERELAGPRRSRANGLLGRLVATVAARNHVLAVAPTRSG